MSDEEEHSERFDAIDSALHGLTLPERLPDAAMIAMLQRTLEQAASGPRARELLAGRYRLEREIGRGGMGVVWQAYDLELRRHVAIKTLTGATDAWSFARMRREARAVARLAHPNVAAVYDVAIDAEPPFIAMELVEGGDLGSWLDREPRPSWTKVVAAFEQAGLGLAAAHGEGLVHRDFKPANVIVGGDRVRVVDFGLARVEHPPRTTPSDPLQQLFDPAVTRTGTMLGTPAYMAPEQYVDGAVTAAADIFSYACSLYEALYGERPYRSTHLMGLLEAKRAGPPSAPPSTALARRVPARFFPIVARGLAPDPIARWPSMKAFVNALRRARRRHPSAWIVGASFSLVMTVWLSGGADADGCVGAVESFERQWERKSTSALRAVTEAGVDPAPRDAVAHTLHEFGVQWAKMARDACAAGSDDARAYNLVDCLEGLRRSAENQVTHAATTPAAARRFAHDLDVFVAIEECGSEALDGLQPMPADPDVRREIAALHAWSRDAAVVDGDDDAARVQRAEATGHRPTVARVRLAIADRHEARGDAVSVLAACESGFAAATAGGSDWLALRAGQACIAACSNLGAVDDALRWNGHIEALSQRLEVDPVEHQHGRALLASALARAGALEEARRLAAEIDRETREHSPWAQPVLEALAEIGMIAIWLDEFPLAVERLERGYALAQRYRDDDDPIMSTYEGRLATAYRYAGRYADAEAMFIRTLARPLSAAEGLMARLNFAQMLADQPARLPDAYALLQPVHDELIGDDRAQSLDLAHVLAALGQLHLKAGRRDEAQRDLSQAKLLYARHLPAEHIYAQNVEQWLARVDALR